MALRRAEQHDAKSGQTERYAIQRQLYSKTGVRGDNSQRGSCRKPLGRGTFITPHDSIACYKAADPVDRRAQARSSGPESVAGHGSRLGRGSLVNTPYPESSHQRDDRYADPCHDIRIECQARARQPLGHITDQADDVISDCRH